ncbi:MAG: ABC transporter ATP-binding protein [Actinobacteria bacterium]|nr:MAG: ABC transporter ATP-binding protein [Actinomycetota bacterium]
MSAAEENSPNGRVYELRDVRRSFRAAGNDVHAVDGVALVVSSGEFVVVEGPSGSGKTTLLQLLGALDRPTSGEVFFGGRDLSSLSDRELTGVRAREIGFVFQTFNLIPTLTALENIEVAMAPLGTSRSEKRARAQMLLDQVGLGARAHHLPGLMSGGEQQRVSIARAMANSPRVILADEPTGNLDSATADDTMKVLVDLCASEGLTLIVVTHSEDVARRSARRLRMRDGKLLDDRAWMAGEAGYGPGPAQPSL